MGRPEEEENWEREMRHAESERTGGGWVAGEGE
jgi:hypothetical protein